MSVMLPVGSNTKPDNLAAAICGFIGEGKDVAISWVGIGAAINAGVALALVKTFMSKRLNKGILERFRFEDVELKGQVRTATVATLDVYTLK